MIAYTVHTTMTINTGTTNEPRIMRRQYTQTVRATNATRAKLAAHQIALYDARRMAPYASITLIHQTCKRMRLFKDTQK
jgi:hypothetical protein